MLNLRLFKGIPGIYNLQFEAQEIQSKKSSVFELRNRIDKIEVIFDINQTLYVDLLDPDQPPVLLSKQPRLKIYYNEEQTKIVKKYIDIAIYKKIDIQKYEKTQLQGISIESQYKGFEMNRLAIDGSTDEIMMNFATAMINGGAKAYKSYAKIWKTTLEYPMEDLETGCIGHLNFTDLTILPMEYGEFALIFSVNGI